MALLAVLAPLHRLAEPGIVAILANWTGDTERLVSGLVSTYMTARLTDEAARAVMIAAGLEPLEPYEKARKPWRCRCTLCGRESSPWYMSVKAGGRCGYCAQVRVAPDEAAVLMIKAGLQPLESYRSSGRPWRCRCTTCGRESTPTFSNVQNGVGCAWCAQKRVDPVEAAALMTGAGLQPLELFAGAHKPWRCRCTTCGRESTPTFSNVQNGKRCVFCGGNRVDPDEAFALMTSAGLHPLEPYRGNGLPWRCLCVTCSREVSPSYSSVRTGSGCRFCAPSGIDYAAPGVVYLMHHPDLFCLKVGVSTTAAKQVRVDAHAKKGWVTIATWGTHTGDDAEQIEQQILGWWRNELGAPVALTKSEMPSGGWSETAALIHVDIDDTIARITRLIAEL